MPRINLVPDSTAVVLRNPRHPGAPFRITVTPYRVTEIYGLDASR